MVSYKNKFIHNSKLKAVLILVVMEDGLVLTFEKAKVNFIKVLILVVMEDGLVLDLIRHY